jgi:TM2 domain-containing membrane protein YozV
MKNKKTASLLALFLGGLGIHRFYLGQTMKGVFSIIFSWTMIPWIIGVVDFFILLYMSQEFFDVKYNQKTQLRCSACDNLLFKDTISFWNLGKGNAVCRMCFQKFRQKSRETGKYEFTDVEVKKIVVGEIKNRPLPPSNSLTVNIPKEEFFEIDDLPEGIDILQLNTLAFISYKDAQGQESDRRVTIKSIYQIHDDYMISAHCHEREAHRTFKLSRIKQLTDIETGEIFAEPREYFLERFNDSPIGKLTKIFQELEDEILVLSFMARADGFLRQKEREIIAKYIQNRSDVDLDNEILDREIRRTYCESSDFRKSLKKINKNPEIDKIALFNSANEIVNSEKKTDPIELGILELIKKELKLDKASA